MKKVLIVDDTKNIRTLLSTCLEIEGYHVAAVNDGNQALNMLADESFDLVFMDVKMPEISGTEVLRRMRELDIYTPVIIMTAFATVKNAVDCTKLGAVTYLQKPFTAEKIKSVLNEIANNGGIDQINDLESTIENAKELIKEGSYTKALNLLRQILSNDINNSEIYLLISKVYEGMGDLDNSSKFYKVYQLFSNR